MICTLKIILEITEDKKVNYNIGSSLQGVIMDFVNPEYGDELHRNSLKPYSQYVDIIDNKNLIWTINSLNQEFTENVINKIIANNPNEIFLRHNNIRFKIVEMQKNTISYSDLIKRNYLNNEEFNFIKIKFRTPTSFKVNNDYEIFPNMKLIYNSLINKYNMFASDYEITDPSVIENMILNTKIVDYKLRSLRFHLEGIKVKSFIGEIKIYIKGPKTLKNLINLLLDFGQFSGVGIKSAIGMGAITIE